MAATAAHPAAAAAAAMAATAAAAAAATAAAASKGGRCEGKRCTERACDENPGEFPSHPRPPWLSCSDGARRKVEVRRPKSRGHFK
jgi:hypothetical protein